MKQLYCVKAYSGRVDQSIKITTYVLDFHEKDGKWYFDRPEPRPGCCRMLYGLGYLENDRVIFHDHDSYPLEQWAKKTKTADEFVFWTTDAKRATASSFSWLECQLQVSKKLAEQVA